MSTRTEEISGATKSAGAQVTEAVVHSERLLQSCRTKAETAATHGWGGVHANLEQAAEHLEGAVSQLQIIEQACETTRTVLAEITEKMSTGEVVAHLVTASGSLGEAQTAAEGGIGLIDEAIGACEAAGVEPLAGSINSLREETEEIYETLGQVGSDIDSERQQGENFAEDNDDGEESLGN